MKKFLIVLGLIVVILIGIIVVVPFLFKDQIVELVKTEANKNINATLDFEDIRLSLLKNFPELTLTIGNLCIINQEPFDGDTLLNIAEFQATIDLKSLIMGDQVEVISIGCIRPYINARINKQGYTNWDIVPETEADTTTDTATAAYNLAVKHYYIENANLVYTDDSTGMYAEIKGLNHFGSGDFSQALFTLNTATDISNLTVKLDNVPYLNQAELEMKADIEIDLDNMKFAFKENEVRLNKLGLKFDGQVSLINDQDIQMDVSFNAFDADFKNILSMIPYVYRQDFTELRAEGQLTFKGTVNGLYSKNSIPSFMIFLNVKNGLLQYPDLPTPVENVEVNLRVFNRGNTFDHTVIDLKKLFIEILNEPIDIEMLVKTPVSDPFMDIRVKSVVNLGEVQNWLPVEGILELKGMINTDFEFKGNMSALEKKQPEKLTARGNVSLTDFEYVSDDIPEKIQISNADLSVNPQKASLNSLDVRIGKSDISANGSLDNMIGFILADQTLKGILAVRSDYFNINPWLTDEEDTTSLEPIELPDKIEFLLTADFKHLLYDNLNLKEVKGKFLLKDRMLEMINMKADLLEGSMVTNGNYTYIPPQNPRVSFDLNVSDFSIPEMYRTFVTVQKLAPMAENIKGQVSGDIELHSDLDDSLTPVWSSLNSKGNLNIPRASIENFEPLNKVADKLKLEQLRNPTMVNFNPTFQIKDGRFYIQPTTLNIDKYRVTASGSNGMDKSLDYLLKIDLPSSDISRLTGQDVSLLTAETIEVDVLVKGTLSSPDVSVDLDKVVKGITDQLKKTAQKEAEKKKAELENKVKVELEKKKKQEEEKLKKELEEKKKEEEDKIKKKLKDLFK